MSYEPQTCRQSGQLKNKTADGIFSNDGFHIPIHRINHLLTEESPLIDDNERVKRRRHKNNREDMQKFNKRVKGFHGLFPSSVYLVNQSSAFSQLFEQNFTQNGAGLKHLRIGAAIVNMKTIPSCRDDSTLP